jgi:hypothetical protein
MEDAKLLLVPRKDELSVRSATVSCACDEWYTLTTTSHLHTGRVGLSRPGLT